MTKDAHERASDRRSLAISLTITLFLFVIEIVGGVLTHSLALVADAGHNASDSAALALSLGAVWLASRPATVGRTYGLARAEILAAFVNSLALALVAVFVFYSAALRFGDPPEVSAGPMLAIAAGGLVVNVVAAKLLWGGQRHSMNMRSAFLHVVGDSLSSVGAIAAGAVILGGGGNIADPIASVIIGVIILISSFRITWDATRVLLEAAPAGMSTPEIQRQMMEVPGVRNVHDFHVWTVTSGFVSLSAHIETDPLADQHKVLLDLRTLLSRNFGIDHATLQLETSALHRELEACCGVDTEETPSHAVHHA